MWVAWQPFRYKCLQHLQTFCLYKILAVINKDKNIKQPKPCGQEAQIKLRIVSPLQKKGHNSTISGCQS